MITEAYARISSITFDSKKPETEGNVGIKQWFHVGSFINYAIIDTQYNRILVFKFLLCPSEKRDLMHELESIIKSVEVIVFIFISL
jgi:hypothetical protein